MVSSARGEKEARISAVRRQGREGDVTACFIYRAEKSRLCIMPPLHDTWRHPRMSSNTCVQTWRRHTRINQHRPGVCDKTGSLHRLSPERYIYICTNGEIPGDDSRWVNATSRSDRLNHAGIGTAVVYRCSSRHWDIRLCTRIDIGTYLCFLLWLWFLFKY